MNSLVKISGIPDQGNELTLDISALNDQGITSIQSYHWIKDGGLFPNSDGRAATSNPNALGFPLESTELGSTISVQVTYIDNDGTTKIITSNALEVRSIINVSGNNLEIDASHIPDGWNGQGMYINGSSTVVNYNNTELQPFTVLYPNGTTLDLSSYQGIEEIEFRSSNQNDYFNASSYEYSMHRWSPGNDTYIGALKNNESEERHATL